MEEDIMENTTEFNYDKLIGRIIEKYKTRENFASKVPMSIPTLVNKLSDKVDFKSREILRFCALLDIPKNQIPDFFYNLT